MNDHDDAQRLTVDAEFLAHLRDGDDAAFDRLVRAYGEPLIRYATGLIGAADMAQDVVQEVFLHLWHERMRIDSSWDIAAYLYGVTRQRGLNVIRATHASIKREERWAVQQQVETTATIDTTTDDAVEMRTLVWNALAGVSPRCREVFMLVWDDELPYVEIARRMGLTEPTVRSYMSRALKQLIDVLKPRYRL